MIPPRPTTGGHRRGKPPVLDAKEAEARTSALVRMGFDIDPVRYIGLAIHLAATENA